MPTELQEALDDIARRQLILSHKLALWFTLAVTDRDSDMAKNAGSLLLSESYELHEKIRQAVQGGT